MKKISPANTVLRYFIVSIKQPQPAQTKLSSSMSHAERDRVSAAICERQARRIA